MLEKQLVRYIRSVSFRFLLFLGFLIFLKKKKLDSVFFSHFILLKRTTKNEKKNSPSRLLEGVQVRDEVSALLGLLEASEGHLGAGHELLGVFQIDIEHVVGPDDAGVLVGLAVGVPLDRAGLAVVDTEEVGTHAVGAALGGGVALRGTTLEDLLTAGGITFGEGFASLRGHGEDCFKVEERRKPNKKQERRLMHVLSNQRHSEDYVLIVYIPFSGVQFFQSILTNKRKA
ncbi:cytochrome c [Angomonas deanei]|nr:cytochrome c [Angomonas deanei]|eukprot:EPY42486.1 cytochrome c [Angomonas deanei]